MTEKMQSNFQFKLDEIVNDSLEKRNFSACSLGFFSIDKGIISKQTYYYGKTGIGEEKKFVCKETLFDLASLTKPLVTSLVFLHFVNKGILKFEDEIGKYFKVIDSDKATITLYNLLTHTSGLPAHQPYFYDLIKIPTNERKNFVLKSILQEKLLFKPGNGILYSDLGFILLGIIIEIATGEHIDILWEKNIFYPLKIENELFFPKRKISETYDYAETGCCSWSKKILKGSVHDDNCRALGGVAGHAGLFGTTPALLSYIIKIMLEIKGINNTLGFNRKILKSFKKRRNHSTWFNGFDTPSPILSSCGKYFSSSTFGHLGYTGTSFWFDMKKECGVVLLTNRVLCCEESGPIRKFRPLIHNLVMSHLKNEKDKSQPFFIKKHP